MSSAESHIYNDAGEKVDVSINDTLTQRGSRYGSFKEHATLSRDMQSLVRANELPEAYMQEAAIMICHKLARIVNGDPYYDDSWRDIAGYAQLVVDILNGKNT